MKRLRIFILGLILSCSMVLNTAFPVHAMGAAAASLAAILGTTVLTSAVGTATSSLVDSWLGVDRGYYNGSGSNVSYDYSNNMARNTNLNAGGNITNSGANNENCWNSYTNVSTTNNTYALVRNNYDSNYYDFTTEVYNPVTNNYHTVNNVQYSANYNTYYMETNNYNYYVTNNYTYVSYYITNTTNNTTNYYEIYYELPDGRNSFYLTASEVWGEYFIYDVKRADVVAEDDGKTLALYHLDENTVDYSYHEQLPLPYGNGMFSEGRFENGIYLNTTYRMPMPSDLVGKKDFTFECFLRTNKSKHQCFFYLDTDYIKNSALVPSGLVHFAFYFGSDGYLDHFYMNGRKYPNTYIDTRAPEYHFSSYNAFRFSEDFSVMIIEPSQLGAVVLDEVRISLGEVYSGDFINVPAQPFDTNEILVLPDEADQGDIIVAAGSDFKNFRIGGVRPTYPSEGFVHIILDEKGTVHDAQQYAAGAWNSCEAKIYKDGEWFDLKGFNLEYFGMPDSDNLKDDSSGSGGSGGSSDKDDSGSSGGSSDDSGVNWDGLGSGLSSIVEAISGFFGLILESIGKIVTLVTDFFSSFLSMFDSFTVFTEGFGNFLKSAFVFLPEEIVAAIVVGINICVVIAIFKFMRN